MPETEQKKILMVCYDDETQRDAGEMFKRVSAALSAVDTFCDASAKLDENAPNLTQQYAPLIERLVLSLMAIYPISEQLAIDAKSIGDFTVRKVPQI